MQKLYALLLALGIAVGGVVACEPADDDDVDVDIEEGVEDAGDAVEDAGDEVEDATQ